MVASVRRGAGTEEYELNASDALGPRSLQSRQPSTFAAVVDDREGMPFVADQPGELAHCDSEPASRTRDVEVTGHDQVHRLGEKRGIVLVGRVHGHLFALATRAP